MPANNCKHRWRPYTFHKAKCTKCKRAVPWVDLVASADVLAAWLTSRSKELTASAKRRARQGSYTAAVQDDAMASAYAFAALHVSRARSAVTFTPVRYDDA